MPQPPTLRVRVETSGPPSEHAFTSGFRIGRSAECGLRIVEDFVSRQHAEAVFEDGDWWLRDLGSTNGIMAGGSRVERVRIDNGLKVRLGSGGPFLVFEVYRPPPPPPLPPPPAPAPAAKELDSYIERYFREGGNEPAGEHTMMIRKAYSQVHKTETLKHKRKYSGIIAALGVLVAAAAGYAAYIHYQTKDQIQLARELFYAMKSMDVEIARLERLIEDSGSAESRKQILEQRKRRAEMNLNYDRFLDAIRVRDKKLTEPQKLIVRVARIFGECELDVPPAFLKEVESYIGKWQSTGRFSAGVRIALDKGYVRPISSEFLSQQLPPQFLYLAMQESNFDPFASGPPTRFGIAKGMWQFIPKTGTDYGLSIGPLVELPRPDPADGRHDWQKSTRAAARYIKDLYSTDAQASGLLVMACYNWGENQVLPLVRSMPPNPRERNFWRLLANHRDRLPQETYDYVFYIVSAAVIGENPRLFGFPFDSPLAQQ